LAAVHDTSQQPSKVVLACQNVLTGFADRMSPKASKKQHQGKMVALLAKLAACALLL
jgi:hypothetical protein